MTISEEILGKGGFGAVYIADYNGRNAAAKVIYSVYHNSVENLSGTTTYMLIQNCMLIPGT